LGEVADRCDKSTLDSACATHNFAAWFLRTVAGGGLATSGGDPDCACAAEAATQSAVASMSCRQVVDRDGDERKPGAEVVALAGDPAHAKRNGGHRNDSRYYAAESFLSSSAALMPTTDQNARLYPNERFCARCWHGAIE
jgi:hypothetical protein